MLQGASADSVLTGAPGARGPPGLGGQKGEPGSAGPQGTKGERVGSIFAPNSMHLQSVVVDAVRTICILSH